MRIIDVTGIIEEGMWNYGEPLPKVKIKRVSSLDDGKYGEENYAVTLGSITGTYLETGAHRLPNQPSIDQIPVIKMVTEAVVIKLSPKGPSEHITKMELESSYARIKRGNALLIYTGWDRMWNKRNFVTESPHFSEEAIDWILGKKISILGGDIPCYDDPYEPEGLVNKIFEEGVLILAPLVNLDEITKTTVKLIALPLKIKGVCGSPCRAIVIEE